MRTLLSISIGLVSLISARAQYVPSWWLDGGNLVLSPSAQAQNLAVANAGQLKWMALRAKVHFDATLPGGAGLALESLVAGFKPQVGTTYTAAELAQFRRDNFAPLNLGQLKAVALPFYDRLWNLTPRYDTNLSLKANGYPQSWASQYPWISNIPASANYKPVSIGQLKLVFSFDIVDSNQNGTLDYLEGFYPAASATRDTDGDGVPDVLDAYPNDPSVAVSVIYDPNDHTSPTVTISQPIGTILTP